MKLCVVLFCTTSLSLLFVIGLILKGTQNASANWLLWGEAVSTSFSSSVSVFPSGGVAAARLGYLSPCLVGSSHGSARHLEPKPEEQPTVNKSPRCPLSNIAILSNVSMRSTVSVSSVFIEIMESIRPGSPITNWVRPLCTRPTSQLDEASRAFGTLIHTP